MYIVEATMDCRCISEGKAIITLNGSSENVLWRSELNGSGSESCSVAGNVENENKVNLKELLELYILSEVISLSSKFY
jgi:hypothetical protein